jgi:hypothetical protein
MLNNIENKGEFDGLSQITQMKNCAIGDAVAQLKMKWRKFVGAIAVENFLLSLRGLHRNTELYDTTVFIARAAFAAGGH